MTAGFCPRYPFVPDQIQPASLDLRLGRSRLSGARELPARPRRNGRQRIDELKLHEIVLTDGAVLETGCVYIVPLIESLRFARRHRGVGQSEKLDRPARRFHPRHCRRDARLRSHRSRLSWPALCRDQPAHVSGAGARRLAAVADPFSPRQRRASTPTRCARCMRANGWSTATEAMMGDGVAVERRSRRRRARAAASAIAPSAIPG